MTETATKPAGKLFPTPRFGLRFLFLVLTALCLWLGWRFSISRKHNQLVSDALVDHAVTSLHWQAIEADPTQLAAMQLMFSDLSDHPNYAADFLLPTGKFTSTKTPTNYERQLLKRWTLNAGGQQTTFADQPPLVGPYSYYKPIKAKKTCIICHSPQIGTPLKVGDLIAVAKITTSGT